MSDKIGRDSDLTPSESPSDYGPAIRATIFRPVSVFMLFVAFLVVGLLAFPKIRTELLPSGMSSGHLGIYIPVMDSTAREVMEQVAKPTEDLLRTLPGLKKIISSSGSRRCMIRLEFDSRYEMGVIVMEARDRLERARISWPDAVDRYFIWRQRDSDIPAYISSLGIEVENDDVDLDYVFDEIIRRRLERVQGVASVKIWGLLDKRVEIQLDRNLVHAYGIDLRKLIQKLSLENTAITAGRTYESDRELVVRVDGRFKSFEEVLDYPVGTGFRIRDFAKVGYRSAVRDRLSRVNGKLSRVIVVSKESSANAVDVCHRIEREIANLETLLKKSVQGIGQVESHAWLNQGEMISSSVNNLAESGLYGGLCAVIVLFLFFRRVSLTLLVMTSIPFSLLITVIWIYFSGGSFNLLSLMGLSLAVGMLVDNSIVVVENILRHSERGLSARASAIAGIREVGLAVGLATLTTVLVLVPILFTGEAQFKKMTQALGLPLCISILASLLVALVFIPQGAIHLQRPRHLAEASERKLKRYSFLNRASGRLLGWCLKNRLLAAGMALGLLWTTTHAFELLAKSETDMDGPRNIEMRLELPGSFLLKDANDTFAAVEAHIRAKSEKLDLGVDAVTSWFDSSGGELNVFIESGRRLNEKEFFEAVNPLPKLPGVKYQLGYESFSQDKGGQRIRVFIQANDFDRLQQAELQVRLALEDRKRFPLLGEVARWTDEEREEVRVQVDRKDAQFFGVDTATVSKMVSWALRGAPLPDFVMNDRELPFWIGYDDAQKENVEELNSILIYRPDGTPVRLDSVASYKFSPGSGDIHRRQGKLTAGLSAGIKPPREEEAERSESRYRDLMIRAHVESELRKLKLPEGCEISMTPPGGGFEQDMTNMTIALGMALCLVFFVMGALFESWLLPLSVLFSIPFAFLGSVWLLLITRIPLDAVGLIGMLMLVGIVVNNAIVLVDYINRLRSDGTPRHLAIRRAVEARFRPIWMTALTTICGLLPLALFASKGQGVDYQSLAVVIMGGLATSTFFTMFIVPLLYSALDDMRRLTRALFQLD